MVDRLSEYFPRLSESQLKSFAALQSIYEEWNAKINVVSRKDIDNLMIRHVLHSLAIAKFITFNEASILDLGCGGGFPGIPLAILFPDSTFHLVDARSKKITVVDAVVNELGLKNVISEHGRAEELKSRYDFVITRAVAKLDVLMTWSRKLISNKQKHAMPNGLIALKGGDLKAERALLASWEYVEQHPILSYFNEDFFEEKYVVYVQA